MNILLSLRSQNRNSVNRLGFDCKLFSEKRGGGRKRDLERQKSILRKLKQAPATFCHRHAGFHLDIPIENVS